MKNSLVLGGDCTQTRDAVGLERGGGKKLDLLGDRPGRTNPCTLLIFSVGWGFLKKGLNDRCLKKRLLGPKSNRRGNPPFKPQTTTRDCRGPKWEETL